MSYEINFLGRYDTESILAEFRRIAEVIGERRVKVSDLERVGRVTLQTVLRRFGSIHNANEAAGLEAAPPHRFSDEDLLRMVLQVWDRTLANECRRPIRTDLRKYGFAVNPCTVVSRFGTWNNALLAAKEFSEKGRVERAPRPRIKRGHISDRRRFLVFKRDQYRCQICRAAGVALFLDHIVPVALGGSDEMHNLQALCEPCNRGKSASLQ